MKKKGVKITDDIRKAVEKEIEDLDKDKDGKISLEEAINGMKKAADENEDDIKKKFKEMDKNKDGKIDEDELVESMMEELRKQAKKEIKALDKDGDGKISEQELRDALKKEKEKEKDTITKEFEKADTDKSGGLTEEEIIEGLKKAGVEITDEIRERVKENFKRGDTNGDGKITEEEYRELRKNQQEKKKAAEEDEFYYIYDVDNDCSLSREELGAAINDICLNGSFERCQALVDILEDESSLVVQLIGTVVGEIERLFHEYDTDDNGRLTLNEIVEARLKKGLMVSLAVIQRIAREIIMADQNGDMQLCLKEIPDYPAGQIHGSCPFLVCPDFELYDTTVDNLLSEEEIIQALVNNGENATQDLQDHVSYQIVLFDSDMDGLLSCDELMAAIQWDRETGLIEQYQRFDADNSGDISEHDILETLGDSYIIVPASDRTKISEEFAIVDTNSDQAISQNEFINALTRDKVADIEEKFKKYDINNDGELSALELVLALIDQGTAITADVIRKLQKEIKIIDTDANKCISLAEMKAALCSAWTASLSLSCYIVVFFTVIYTSIWSS